MIAHRLRRIAQTPRAFANWPGILVRMALPAGRPDSLMFVTRDGQQISCPNRPGARVPVYEVFAEDCYRIESFLGPLCEREFTALDIGAHVGAFACRLAAVAPRATVHCYEPSPSTARFLEENLARNGLADRVIPHVSAVAGTSGWATFADNGAGSALNGLAAVGAANSRVPAVTFDEVVREIGPSEIVKIDCEGGEYDLVLASDPASWAAVTHVVLEYHPSAGAGWPDLRRWFAAAGLDVVAEEPATAAQGTAWLRRDAA